MMAMAPLPEARTGAGTSAPRRDRPGPATGRRRPAPPLLTLAGAAAAVLGLGLRLWIVASDLGPADADEAVVGLMARAALGGELRTFFWGQEYGGSQEALALAALLAAGMPTAVAMELLPLAGAAGLAVLVWRNGRRLTIPPAAAAAGLAAWVASPAMLWMSTKERAFYASTALFGLGAILAVLRYREAPTARRAALAGLLAGLAWWASPQSLYLLVPAALAALVPRPRRLRPAEAAAAAAGLAAGAAPWLYTNLGTGFASFQLSGRVPETTYGWRLGRFFREGLPVLLGLRRPVELGWVLGAVGQVAYVLVALALAAAVVIVARRSPHRWLAAGVALYPFLFALLPTSTYTRDPRYLSFLFPLAVLAVAVVAGLRWRATAVALALATLCLSSAVGTAGFVRYAAGARGLSDVAPGSVRPLVAELGSRGIEAVFADYWVSSRLPLATDGRISASPVTDLRSPALERAVRAAPVPSYVLFAEECSDVHARRALADLGIGFRRTVVDRYAVVTPERRVMPEELVRDWAEDRGVPPGGAAPAHVCRAGPVPAPGG